MKATKRDIFSLIEYEAERDDALAELVQRAAQMTDAEIDSSPVKLPWMRKALRAIRERDGSYALEAAILRHVAVEYTADPWGEIRQWQAGSTFVRIGSANGRITSSQLEIKCGELVWFDASGVWIDTIYSKHVDPALYQNTMSVRRATKTEYMRAVRERLVHNAPSDPAPRDSSWSSSIRIYRL